MRSVLKYGLAFALTLQIFLLPAHANLKAQIKLLRDRYFSRVGQYANKYFTRDNICKQLLTLKATEQDKELFDDLVEFEAFPGFWVTQEIWKELVTLASKLGPKTTIERALQIANENTNAQEGTLPRYHEWEATVVFAKFFNRMKGEGLVLIPSLDSQQVPGFDGVVLDKDKKVSLNFSLKNVFRFSFEDQLNAALRKGFRYSFFDSWVNVYLDPNNTRPSETWLSSSSQVFGAALDLNEVRPLRILIYLEKYSPGTLQSNVKSALKVLKDYDRKTADKLIESIWIAKDGQFARIAKGKVTFHE